MYLDSNLKIEIISSLLGRNIKTCDKKRRGAAEDILSVDQFHLHNLIGKQQAYVKQPVIKEEDFFDPQYDCDFTNLSDSAECTRGDELYERPKGWYRMGLKVKGKYPDGDTWLGTDRWRSHSVPGEWPVSYHGTSLDGAKGIIRSHYNAGDRAMYGRGIYSTPDIHVAEREEYARTFTSKTTGKSYKVILQNRINPKNREICQRLDYWLIRVHEGASAKEEKQIVESSIRPYGILIKELSDDGYAYGDGDKDGNEENDDDDNDSDDDDGNTDDSYNDDNGENDDDNADYNCDDVDEENGYGDGNDIDNEIDDDGNGDEDDNGDCDDDDNDDYDNEDNDDDGENDDRSADSNCDDDDDDDENGYSDGDDIDSESDDDGNIDEDDNGDCDDDDNDDYDNEDNDDDGENDDGNADSNCDDDDDDENGYGDGDDIDSESDDDGNIDEDDNGDCDDDDNDDYDDDANDDDGNDDDSYNDYDEDNDHDDVDGNESGNEDEYDDWS